jgi:hypothetical protein
MFPIAGVKIENPRETTRHFARTNQALSIQIHQSAMVPFMLFKIEDASEI